MRRRLWQASTLMALALLPGSPYLAAKEPAADIRAAQQSLEQGKGMAGLALLAAVLPDLQAQWRQHPTPDHARAYARALALKARLHELLAQTGEAAQSRDRAHEIALQALGGQDADVQELLSERIYAAISAQDFSKAQALSRELESSLPRPLKQCKSAICLELRFQQANLAATMGHAQEALDIALELAAIPEASPDLAAWNVYHLVYLTGQLRQARQMQHWCQRADAMARDDAHARNGALARAQAMCLSGHGDAQTFEHLLQAELQAHGAGSQGSSHMLSLQAGRLLEHGDYAAAARTAGQAWATGLARQEPFWQQWATITIAQAMEGNRRMPEAIFYGKLALRYQQILLARSGTLPPEQLDAMLRNSRGFYETLARWLLQQQRFAEAEQVLALAREHGYHRLVRQYRPAQQAVALTPDEQAQLLRLAPLQQRLEKAWSERESDASSALSDQLDSLQPLLASRLPQRPRGATPPLSLPPVAPGKIQVLFLPAPQQLHVVLRSAQVPDRYLSLPVRQDQLVQDIALLRRQLQQPRSQPLPLAQKLYRQLWQPLLAYLPAGQPLAPLGQAPEVQLHPEGPLRYLPFAALHDGSHWLGESYALPLDTGLAHEAAKPASARAGWALLGASKPGGELPALPQVREEIDALARIAQSRGIAYGKALDGQFTAAALRTALQSSSVVHLASHFRLQPGDGQASGLYLGDGSLLTLRALDDPSYRFDGLELLTLSACETALPSGPQEEGLPVDSLAWLAQAKGAKHVLASLWAVADEATRRYMDAFYSALGSGMPHAQAVRSAQLSMLAAGLPVPAGGRRGLAAYPASADLSSAQGHPYYWSGFVLLSAAH